MARPQTGPSQQPRPLWNTENKPSGATVDKAPITKVAVIPAGGALSIVLLWFSELLNIPMSTEVAIALSTLITLGVSYMVPERQA